jgi:hypothetical protein
MHFVQSLEKGFAMITIHQSRSTDVIQADTVPGQLEIILKSRVNHFRFNP